MKALLIIEDVDVDGTPSINVATQYVDGFHAESHAHQHMGLVVKVMDKIAERIGAGETRDLTLDQLDPVVAAAIVDVEREMRGADADEEESAPHLTVASADELGKIKVVSH